MSLYSPRTGRYADDFMVKLHDGTATVGDLISHAQEIIVEDPTGWGTVVAEPVRLLLLLVDALAEEDTGPHQHTLLTELDPNLRKA